MRKDVVLVTIDDPDVQRLAAAALRHGGYAVLEAAVRDSVAATEQNHVSVVVVDARSPETAGSELVRRLRLTRPDLKVLYLIDRHSARAHADAYLHKPFFLEELSEAVGSVLFGRCRCPSCTRQTAVARK